MQKRFVVLAVLVFALVSAVPAQAEERPIQLALINPVQLFNEGDSVKGIRLDLLYGKNTTVVGFDWGLVNHTTAGVSKGWEEGFVNITEADFNGLQEGAVNIVRGHFQGLQSGFFNKTHQMGGLQLGFVNYAETLNGLQIGLVNIIKQGGAFPVFPIVNWSFN